MKSLILLTAFSFAAVAPSRGQTTQYLDAGNIRSLIGAGGHLWWDTATGEPRCEYPKASGKHVGFAGGLWVGGYDTQGQLRVAANTYRQSGNDYWQGPVGANGVTDPFTQAEWNKIWKVSRAEITAAVAATASGQIATVPAAVKGWPARGNLDAVGANGALLTDLIYGPSSLMPYAPFVDVNNNGTYDWQAGDYPDLRGGDQILWQMYSDAGGTKTSTGTASIPLQIGLAAWAYNRGTVADNIQVYEYTLTNRGGQLDSAVVGFFADLDIGVATNEYIGFDSTRRLGYNYNATTTDGTGQGNSYGSQIPSAGLALLRVVGDAPLAGVKVPAGAFTYFVNGGGFPSDIQDPTTGLEFYRYMTGLKRSGAPFTRDFLQLNGPPTRFLYDGNPSVGGTWSECFVNNAAGDRRFLLSASAFTFPANSSRTIALALLAAPNAGGCPTVSLTGLQQTADTAIKLYDNPPPFVPNSIAQLPANEPTLRLFPNPAGDLLFIHSSRASTEARIEIVDLTGRTLDVRVERTTNGFQISTARLPGGVYAVRLTDTNGSATGTFVKQ